MATCVADSGSMTDCQPICSKTATHRVTYGGYRGPYTAEVCRGHVSLVQNRAYPYESTVEVIA